MQNALINKIRNAIIILKDNYLRKDISNGERLEQNMKDIDICVSLIDELIAHAIRLNKENKILVEELK